MSSLRRAAGAGWRSVRTALFCRFRGMPPNLATSGFLPARSTVASKQVRGPCGVAILAWYLRAIFVTVERVLSGQCLEH